MIIPLVLVRSMSSVAAQASTIVQIQPQTLAIASGEKAQFSVEILDAENIYGFELHLAYDPTKVHVVDVDPSIAGIQLFPGDMYEVSRGFLVANEADNEAGTAVFAFTLLAPAPPLTGNGNLVMGEIEATGYGWSTIDLEEVILASPDGEALPFITNDGEVIIEGAPESTPTFATTPAGQSTLTATMTVSTTGTLMAGSSVSPVPTMQIPESTSLPTQKVTHGALSTLVDSREPGQFDQRSMTFGLVILAVVILLILVGAWLLRWWARGD